MPLLTDIIDHLKSHIKHGVLRFEVSSASLADRRWRGKRRNPPSRVASHRGRESEFVHHVEHRALFLFTLLAITVINDKRLDLINRCARLCPLVLTLRPPTSLP